MLAPGSQHAYRFIQADTPELRRLPWARMQDEGLAHAVLWERALPSMMSGKGGWQGPCGWCPPA